MTTMRVVGECFFWYRLTRVFPDKFHRAVKRLCVVCCWPYSCEQNVKNFEKFDESFEGGGVKEKHFPSAIST